MTGAADRTTAAGGSVLRRRIAARAAALPAGPGAAEVIPVPATRTPDRIIASAIASAAERVHGLPLFFDRVTTGHAVVAELGDLFPEQALICVVEAGGDRIGAVAICPGLLTSLIEIQALGRVSSRAAVPRRPTRTDAAISTEFVDACLSALGRDLASHPGFEGIEGYRYASFLDDPRPLELMLDDTAYRLISVVLRAGPSGQRDGRMVFVLPAQPAALTPALPLAERPVAAAPAASGDGVIAAQVQDVPIELFGVLCRRAITLGELQALAPGDQIALPPGALGLATLETPSGQTLAQGRLGALAGRHALRITAPAAGPSTDPAARFDASAGMTGTSSAEEENDHGWPAAGATLLHPRGLVDDLPLADLGESDSFRPDDPQAQGRAGEFPSALASWEDTSPLGATPMQVV